jgi:two-component system response regulator NreC
MIKVFLVDDHQMFRDGLKHLIQKNNNMKVVGEADDGIIGLHDIIKLKPHVAVVDISIPGLNGIELTKQIKKRAPEVEVLILSMHADTYFVTNAIKSGAKGYILKEDSFKLLIEAVMYVARGKIMVSPAFYPINLNKIFQNERKEDNNSIENLLTEREIQILQMIAEGYTNTQIAEKLFISTGTVDTHRKNIMKKLNIHNVSGLVKYAIKHKIIVI